MSAPDAVSVETTAVTAVTTVTTTEVTETHSTEVDRVEEEIGFKVFVGNLAFQTTEQELAEFFGNVGKVLKANIITRGTRSLGYGFVALETEDDVNKVVTQLNRQELGGRQINVEVAKPKAAITDGQQGSAAPSVRRGRGRFGYRGRGRGRGRIRSRGRGRGSWGQSRRRFTGRSGEEGDATTEANDSTAVTASDAQTANGTNADEAATSKSSRGGVYRRRGGRGRGRGRGARGASRRRSTSNPNSGQAAGAAKTGDPSKTIVFVANLPFSITDEGLKEIFKDYNVTSAHVVRRRGGRSKGFGFVELADEEEQQKALEGLKGVKSQERELVIKIALSDRHVPEDEEDKAASEGAAETQEKKEDVTPA